MYNGPIRLDCLFFKHLYIFRALCCGFMFSFERACLCVCMHGVDVPFGFVSVCVCECECVYADVCEKHHDQSERLLNVAQSLIVRVFVWTTSHIVLSSSTLII